MSSQDERRRFFRINEMLGISYEKLDDEDGENSSKTYAPDMFELVTQQDAKIEQLLIELGESNPKVAELAALLNQKLERISSHLAIKNDLTERIAYRVKEVNLSACGLAFLNNEQVALGTRLQLDLTLYPSEQQISTKAVVVACDSQGMGEDKFYWRVDFFGMSARAQEKLIQYVVQCQSAQLKSRRDEPLTT